MEVITRELRGLPGKPGRSIEGKWLVQRSWLAGELYPPTGLNLWPMIFQRYLIEFQGDAETLNQVWPRFKLKIMRPGG